MSEPTSTAAAPVVVDRAALASSKEDTDELGAAA